VVLPTPAPSPRHAHALHVGYALRSFVLVPLQPDDLVRPPSSDDRTVSPSALAVLTLMTGSKSITSRRLACGGSSRNSREPDLLVAVRVVTHAGEPAPRTAPHQPRPLLRGLAADEGHEVGAQLVAQPGLVGQKPTGVRKVGVMGPGGWAIIREVEQLCLRLQRGCGVRGWGRDGLGAGALEGGARARRALMSLPVLGPLLWRREPRQERHELLPD